MPGENSAPLPSFSHSFLFLAPRLARSRSTPFSSSSLVAFYDFCFCSTQVQIMNWVFSKCSELMHFSVTWILYLPHAITGKFKLYHWQTDIWNKIISQNLFQRVSAWIWFWWKVLENKSSSDFVSFAVKVFLRKIHTFTCDSPSGVMKAYKSEELCTLIWL